jgi:sigma-B regulation protein RsbU (phosphoserine phosphatase)
MKGRLNLPTAVFYLLTGVMLFLTVYCFVSAVPWIEKPFAGFLPYDFPYVGSMGNPDWQGNKAGLRFLDRIVSADGQPIWNGRDVVRVADAKEPGSAIQYVIETKGRTWETIIPVTRFSLWDFFLVFCIPFFGGLALYILGFIVYVLKPNTTASWVFFVLCFCLGGYMVTGFETISAYRTVHFHYLILCLYPATFVHLGLVFPEKKKLLKRFPGIEYLIYLPAFILNLAYQIYLSTFDKVLQSNLSGWWAFTYEQIAPRNRLFALFCVASLLALMIHSTFKASSVLARQRARMILFGVAIAFLPSAVIMLIVQLAKVNFPWNFLVFFVIFFPASIAYSIVRHNLFDADTIIKRTVGYVVVTAIVVGAYAGVSLGLNVVMGKYEVAQSRAFPILFTLAVILVFNPLRDRIQAIVDRLFFRKEYDYGKIIDKIGAAMTSLLDQGEILKKLMKTFVEDMFINTSSIMLLQPATAEYRVSLAEGERKGEVEQKAFRRDEPLMQIIEKEKKELTKNDVLEDPRYKAVGEACTVDFEALHATLMVPLVFQEQVIGVMSLGDKKSGKMFNRDDVDLLRTLANQSAVAIENARLFQENLEKQRMEEELAIARDLQMSMLPAACPQIEGFEIAAVSTPAREVGGDFFDFIDMGTQNVGLIIGDVTGKSVSGALVMSASRSIFRMLSEEGLGVGEIMLRANRRARKDIKSGMFVALLYAVLDSQERMLSLCSAGQTQPIYFTPKTGAAKLVQTEGDTFPLGILDEADYQETQIRLEPGDRIVLYTDGIVEAMNDQNEIFGFERLLRVVEDAGPISAEMLLKRIMEEVKAFSGSAPQHDDLTVIVVSAEK